MTRADRTVARLGLVAVGVALMVVGLAGRI